MSSLLANVPMSIFFVLLWSSGFVACKLSLNFTGTFTLLSWRYLIVVILLLFLVSLFNAWRRVSKRELVGHVVVGFLAHGLFLSASISALNMEVPTGLVAFIVALQPMLTAVMSVAVTGERVSGRQWIGLLIGLSSVVLVIGDRLILGDSMFAHGLLLISALSISLAALLDRRNTLKRFAENRTMTPLLLILLIQCSTALTIFLPFAVVKEGFKTSWNPSLVLSILWLAIIVSLGAYALKFTLLRRTSAINVACLIYLCPPCTMVSAYFIFGEIPNEADFAGLFLAGIAAYIITNTKHLKSKHLPSHSVTTSRH